MKTYFRLLAFARPLSKSLPIYIGSSITAIIFGMINFSLLIPLLDVLFNSTAAEQAVMPEPEFSLTIGYLKDLFRYYFTQIMERYGRQGALQYVCGLIAASIFLKNFFRYFSLRILATLRARIIFNIRQDLLDKVLGLHLAYFTNQRRGDLMSRLTNDVNEIENSILNSMTVLFRDPATIIGFFVMLFLMSPELTFFTLIVFPLSGGVIAEVSKRLRKDAEDGQSSLGRILAVVEEALMGFKVVKAFNAQASIKKRFEKENAYYSETVKNIAFKKDLASPLSEFMGVTVVTGLLLYGGMMVLNNESDLTPSQFMTFIILFSQILTPAKSISNAFSNIQKGLAAGTRVFELLDAKAEVTEPANPTILTSFQNKITFENVSFEYEQGRKVLDNISFEILKGQTVALVGTSGGGKSTISDLLPRFYDPTEGRILIDGLDLRALSFASLRGIMGIVTQESVLFNDSVSQNILFGMEASPEQVKNAAQIANADVFISELPEKYETVIGDSGLKLSGGQRQRLNIARAVLKNPDFLILDEATSALDNESEKLVQDALSKLLKGRTSLVIAHRLSTIRQADKIIVLDKGKITEQGTHEELMLLEGQYFKLHQMHAIV